MSEKYNGGESARSLEALRSASADMGLIAMAVIWGVNFPLVKASLDELPPLAFNALRFSLAALTVLIIVTASGRIPWPQKRDWARIVVLGILGNLVYQAFFIFGLDRTLAGNASILLATTPIWTLGLSTARGHEKPGLLVWSGILGTLFGMILVVLGGGLTLGFHGGTLRGDLLIIGAALTWSVYTVGSRGMVKKYGPLPVTAWTLWVGTVGLVILGLPSLLHTPLKRVSPLSWFAVAYSGILAIGLAYLLWYRGVQRIGSSRTAAYSNLTPIVAVGVAWLWLGEVPVPLQLAGAAIVLAGLWLARVGRDRPV